MSVTVSIDPVALAGDLIRRPSITPVDAGALDVLEGALRSIGFSVRRFRFGEVDNLYARRGDRAPNFCFAGHTDVVPPGDESDWTSPPFAAEIRDGLLIGRGAADMKGAIAAFTAAAAMQFEGGRTPPGSISFLITGDEEGPAVDGTIKLLDAITKMGERIDHCLVGEPTSETSVGDIIKVGRRGSLNGVATARGSAGHVAYPDRAENPIPVLLEFLARLMARPLDNGAPHFQPSNLEVTSIDVGNTAHNVIPADARGMFNIRFNTAHTGAQLQRWIEAEQAASGLNFTGELLVDTTVTGEAFLTETGPFTEVLQDAVEQETGRRPALTTGGGTSDARFIQAYAPVAELGLPAATIHKVNERVEVSDIITLTRIYVRILSNYFKRIAP